MCFICSFTPPACVRVCACVLVFIVFISFNSLPDHFRSCHVSFVSCTSARTHACLFVVYDFIFIFFTCRSFWMIVVSFVNGFWTFTLNSFVETKLPVSIDGAARHRIDRVAQRHRDGAAQQFRDYVVLTSFQSVVQPTPVCVSIQWPG